MKKAILALIVSAVLGHRHHWRSGDGRQGPFPTWSTRSKIAEAAPRPAARKEARSSIRLLCIIPVISKRSIGRQIGIDMVMVIDADAADKVSTQLPRLQNAVLLDLYDFVPYHSDTRSAADKEAIHQHLLRLANATVGEGTVHDVIIKSFYDR